MKITESRLRSIIREEVSRLTEAKSIGALDGVRSPRSLKLKLGDIYTNPQRHRISIEFLEGGYAGWELLARGWVTSKDGTLADLQNALADGGFEFDRNEQAY